jgi:tol-pal system protein YbgF
MTFWQKIPFCAVLAGALAGGACAHEEPGKVTVAELNRTVASLRAQNASYERQVQELENRIFILGDQMEARKSAAPPPNPAQPLPKVTLHPSEKTRATTAEPPDEPSDDVEYAGEAARTSAKRPVLRLYGDETPVFSREGDEPTRRLTVTSEGSARPAPRPAAEHRSAEPAHAAGPPAELYRRSLEALRGGRHAEAMAGFRDFLRLYASHDFADNAQYWLAECYYDQKDYPTALREFRRVVEKYPQGNKVPDALLKVGFCHLALGSTDVARQTLEKVVQTYPGQGAAGLASAKLAEITKEVP